MKRVEARNHLEEIRKLIRDKRGTLYSYATSLGMKHEDAVNTKPIAELKPLLDAIDECERALEALGDEAYSATRELHFVCTAFPGPSVDRRPNYFACIFVQCENADGKSVNAGQWRQRSDGLAELVIFK